jgi:hypothetical protein
MTIFDLLNFHKVNHAVICNLLHDQSDWFVVAHKKQLKAIEVNVGGVYEYYGNFLYILEMNRLDVFVFHEMYSHGYYTIKKDENGLVVYEMTDQSFQEYITSCKTNKSWKRQ